MSERCSLFPHHMAVQAFFLLRVAPVIFRMAWRLGYKKAGALAVEKSIVFGTLVVLRARRYERAAQVALSVPLKQC